MSHAISKNRATRWLRYDPLTQLRRALPVRTAHQQPSAVWQSAHWYANRSETVRGESMNIDEIMTTRPVSIPSSASIAEAWEVLQRLEVRHLPVVNEDSELVGILSDRDFGVRPRPALMTNLLGPDSLPLDDAVTTIMSADVLSVTPGDDVSDAAELMIENKIGALPVVDPDRRVVGIVSYLDALRAAYRERD